ncbi:MAG: MoaD/ThiS family protein [Anaerolineae bacterium]|nr:MoaD/ThiS family protein [Anaerolineae bacterium]
MKTIQLLLFANLREKTGKSSLTMDIPENWVIDDILTSLMEAYPHLRPHLTEKIVIAVDGKIALRSSSVSDGQQISLMPPVGGG